MEKNAVSRSLAGIIGPVMVVIVTAELPVWNPHLYDEQITPLVYLSGVLLFIAGLSIVRKHPYWAKSWITLITLVGWAAMLLGLIRIFFPSGYQSKAPSPVNTTTVIIEGILIVLGIYLSWQGYRPLKKTSSPDDSK